MDIPRIEPRTLPTTIGGTFDSSSDLSFTEASGLSVSERPLPAVALRSIVVTTPSARVAVVYKGSEPAMPVSPSSSSKLSDVWVESATDASVLVPRRV
jgi:hypothetical protein